MFLNLLNRIAFKPLLSSPFLFLKSLGLLFHDNQDRANEIFLKVAQRHLEVLRSKKLQQTDKLLNFLCDIHLQNEPELNSGIYDEFSWMFTRKNGKIWVSLAWLWAIQAELGLNLLPSELFKIKLTKNKVLGLADQIHYIHRATYNILAHKGLKPTFSRVYRNTIIDDREIKTLSELARVPVVEYFDTVLDGVLNVRCCSIKPHGCENYDLSLNKNNIFVISKGMNEVSYMKSENVMPTILFTYQPLDWQRFKSTANYKDVLVLDGTQIELFFYLYEIF